MRSFENVSKVNQVIETWSGTTYTNQWFSGIDSNKLSAVKGTVNGDHVTPNPFSFVLTEQSCLRGRVRRLNNLDAWKVSNGALTSTHFGSKGDRFQPVISTLYTTPYNRAVAALYDDIRGSLDLTIDTFQIRQLRQTVEKLRHPTEYLVTMVERLKKRGKQGSAADVLSLSTREFGSLFLEWWYGIRPTLLSAEELGKTVETQLRGGELARRVRARGKEVHQSSVTGDANTFNGYCAFQYVADVRTTVRCQIDAEYKPRNTSLQQISRYVSLNPLAWAYELTLYSFVLDWFWDFGSYLRSMESALIYADVFARGSITYSSRRTASVKSVKGVPYPYAVESCKGAMDSRTYDRKVMQGSPFPKLPRWAPSMGSMRMIALAALLSQSLGRKLPFKFRPRSPGPGKTPRFQWGDTDYL